MSRLMGSYFHDFPLEQPLLAPVNPKRRKLCVSQDEPQ